MAHHRKKGISGEEFVAHFLSSRGFVIAARNVRTPFGEIDLVARKGDLLLFVEVKLRGSEEYGRGAESFTPLKQDRLLKSARVYLAHHGTGKEKVRFDLMELKEREGEIFLENWYPSVLEEGG